MGKVITNPKTYTGRELENIFFRPMLTGPGALELGLNVMYNMPVPTTLNYWRRNINILKKYKKGWQGGTLADKYQKKIELEKVKSEIGYSASDYFGMIYELITNRADVNLDDLSATDLEKAETELFRMALAEAIRVETWLGDTSRNDSLGFNSVNGLIKKIKADIGAGDEEIQSFTFPDMTQADAAEGLFKQQKREAKEILKQHEADLVCFVTDDVLYNYKDTLIEANLESARSSMINGIQQYFYDGTPIIPVKLGDYLPTLTDMPQSFSILAPRKNLAVAVNTGSFPGTDPEIRMWYNPDEMENRQRALFMMGTDYLLPELINVSFKS